MNKKPRQTSRESQTIQGCSRKTAPNIIKQNSNINLTNQEKGLPKCEVQNACKPNPR